MHAHTHACKHMDGYMYVCVHIKHQGVCLHPFLFYLWLGALLIFLFVVISAKKESTEAVQKPVKKGKELRVLDAKAGQNLCKSIWKRPDQQLLMLLNLFNLSGLWRQYWRGMSWSLGKTTLSNATLSPPEWWCIKMGTGAPEAPPRKSVDSLCWRTKHKRTVADM